VQVSLNVKPLPGPSPINRKQPNKRQNILHHLLIRHKVSDFAAWKATYDSHAGSRASAGLTELHLRRSIDNPNEVVMLFSVADLDKAKAFAASEDLRAAMQKAGVTDKPDVYFLD
jgi:quinol monooxygenase YgiN